jgi:esterase/lipase superfamily enzyme
MSVALLPEDVLIRQSPVWSKALKVSRTILLSAGIILTLTACGTRPPESVLAPVVVGSHAPAQEVTVIAVTNRETSLHGRGYGGKWANGLTVQSYRLSVPLNRNGTEIVYPVRGQNLSGRYFVIEHNSLPPNSLVGEITNASDFDGTVAVFVHGYNNSYQEALYRTAQMAADVPSGGAPVLFSWPSAASVMGYVADRDAAMYSRSELSTMLAAVGKSSKVKRILLLGHSMGGFLSMEAVRQLKLQGETKALDKLQILLASPDIDVDVFRSQLLDIGKLPIPITLLVSKSDRALVISSFLAGERERVGKVDVRDPVVEAAAKANRLRVVDISSLKSIDGLGHDRFATFARFGGTLVRDEVLDSKSLANVGAFVFDAAGNAVTGPFRVAGKIIRH